MPPSNEWRSIYWDLCSFVRYFSRHSHKIWFTDFRNAFSAIISVEIFFTIAAMWNWKIGSKNFSVCLLSKCNRYISVVKHEFFTHSLVNMQTNHAINVVSCWLRWVFITRWKYERYLEITFSNVLFPICSCYNARNNISLAFAGGSKANTSTVIRPKDLLHFQTFVSYASHTHTRAFSGKNSKFQLCTVLLMRVKPQQMFRVYIEHSICSVSHLLFLALFPASAFNSAQIDRFQ